MPESLAVAKAADQHLELLDLRVHALGTRIGDPLCEERPDVGPVALEHPRHPLHRLEPAADGPLIPGREMPLRRPRVEIVPEGHQHLLHGPGAPGLELRPSREADEVAPRGQREPVGMPEPVVLRPGQPVLALGLERSVLPPAHLVDRVVGVLSDVELVEDDLPLGARQMRPLLYNA
jgi:hypothetical protein